MKLPESPQTAKFIQLIQWVLNPLQLMETSAKAHGDCFRLSLTGNKPMVFFSNPQAIQEIFSAAPEKFNAGRENRIVKPLLGEQSLILLDGAPTSASDGC